MFSQPNLIDSLLNASDLTLLYDDMGEPVLTEFNNIGIDISLEEARGLKTFVESLSGVTGEPNVELQGVDPMADDVAVLTEGMGVLGQTVASPTVNLPTATVTMETIDAMQTNLDGLDNTIAIPEVTLPTAAGVMNSIDALTTDLDDVDKSVSTPTIVTDSVQAAIDKASETEDGDRQDSAGQTKTVTINVQGGGRSVHGWRSRRQSAVGDRW